MFYKKVIGTRLASRKKFIYLQVPAGRIKWSRWPDPARGPYVAHACSRRCFTLLKALPFFSKLSAFNSISYKSLRFAVSVRIFSIFLNRSSKLICNRPKRLLYFSSILSNVVVKLSTAIISLSNLSPILLDMLYLVVESKPFRRFCLISCSLLQGPRVAAAVYVRPITSIAHHNDRKSNLNS